MSTAPPLHIEHTITYVRTKNGIAFNTGQPYFFTGIAESLDEMYHFVLVLITSKTPHAIESIVLTLIEVYK